MNAQETPKYSEAWWNLHKEEQMNAVDLREVLQARTVQKLPIDDVLPAPFNPAIRVSDNRGAITQFSKDLVKDAQLNPIHVVKFGRSYRTADGHRRWSAMRASGAAEIEAYVYEPGKYIPMAVLHKLYVSLNASNRRLADSEQSIVGDNGGPVFNKGVQRTLDRLAAIFPQGTPTLVKGAGKTLVNISRSATAYCWPSLDKGAHAFLAKNAVVLLWLVRNKQQQYTALYMRRQWSPEALKRAIENDRPVPRLG